MTYQPQRGKNPIAPFYVQDKKPIAPIHEREKKPITAFHVRKKASCLKVWPPGRQHGGKYCGKTSTLNFNCVRYIIHHQHKSKVPTNLNINNLFNKAKNQLQLFVC